MFEACPIKLELDFDRVNSFKLNCPIFVKIYVYCTYLHTPFPETWHGQTFSVFNRLSYVNMDCKTAISQ